MSKLFVLAAALAALVSAQSITASRVLSGSGTDRASLITTDRQGFVYIAGITSSSDFPVTKDAFQPRLLGSALRFSSDRQNFVPTSLAIPRVLSISTSPDARILIAATTAGIIRSTDSGATWTSTNNGLPLPAFAVGLDPANSNRAYAIISDGRIYRTTDAGASWQAGSITIRNYPSTIPPAQITVNPVHSETIYALTGNSSQFFRSDDFGVSWQPIAIPNPNNFNGLFNVTAFAVSPSNPEVLYAAGDGSLRKSTDRGASWTPVAPISAPHGGLAVDPHDENTVWIVNNAGVSKSTDGAASFKPVGLTDNHNLSLIAVDALDSSHILASDYLNVYQSSDGGASFQHATSGLVEQIYPASTGVYLAGDAQATVFAAKFDPTLTQLVYSTFIGTVAGVTAIQADADGNLYVTGTTQSSEFPTTASAMQRTLSSGLAGFVAKLSADGKSLLYSTLLDAVQPYALALDSSGHAVIAGTAARGKLPLTPGALQTATPGPCPRPSPILSYALSIPTSAFVSKINNDASAMLFSTYLAGSCGDIANAVTLDSSGALYLAGETYSSDFPTTAGAITTTFPGKVTSGFISKLSPAADQLLYSTLFGDGFYTAAHAIALDSAGAVVVAGNTQAKATPGAFQKPSTNFCPMLLSIVPFEPAPIGADDAFAMKLTLGAPAPAFLATFGGLCQDSVSSLSLDSAGNIWMAGTTASSDFSTRAPIPGLGDAGSPGAFLAELTADGADLPFATIVGGGAVATGRGSDVFYAGSFSDQAKPEQLYPTFLDSSQVAKLDASATPAIALDQIIRFGAPLNLSPGYFPFFAAPGQVVRLQGRGIGPATKVQAQLTSDGRLDTNIGGVQVLFGVAAPMISAQASEILCIAPFALNGKTSTKVQVLFNGKKSNVYGVAVVSQNPDVVAIANADGTPNSAANPAVIGSSVDVFATGLGQTNPPAVDGVITRAPAAPVQQPAILVNGTRQLPTFFGAAPGQVAGITQINVMTSDPGPASNSIAFYIGSTYSLIYVAKP